MSHNEDPISVEDRSYELPGGKIIQVDHRKRFSASEIIFTPEDAYGKAYLNKGIV